MTAAIRIERLTVAYRGRPALSDADLMIEPGERISLIVPHRGARATP